ncbi:hypothetical protein SCLCIDRAFT_854927 [Scleroderma citrinum Foug A]|uniref:Uncharacterized protein n=1 Tax=Scleroderma citrinum Foug A TaxID=1036808 RepID=A0A0C2YL17_9AGAM|nr:hypothetical protein SCLCIDRAFT_854927 [Scleroderma citrinum Foug A]
MNCMSQLTVYGANKTTCCQANRTRVAVKAVRTDPAAPAMKSLTCCQSNGTRVMVPVSMASIQIFQVPQVSF